MEHKTLHLTLKRKWFDMIIRGEKKEEYRKIKPYWLKRFTGDVPHSCNLESYLKSWLIDPDLPKFIKFTNGYGKAKPSFLIELKDITIDKGFEKWGANPNEVYFVLKLGRILSKLNCD